VLVSQVGCNTPLGVNNNSGRLLAIYWLNNVGQQHAARRRASVWRSRGHRSQPALRVVSHHPYGGGLIEWQVLKSYLMAHSLDIYGRADTASALDPLATAPALEFRNSLGSSGTGNFGFKVLTDAAYF